MHVGINIKKLWLSQKKTIKACKSSDERYALAQSQVAWWREQVMNVGEVNSGSCSSGSGLRSSNPSQSDSVSRNSSAINNMAGNSNHSETNEALVKVEINVNNVSDLYPDIK